MDKHELRVMNASGKLINPFSLRDEDFDVNIIAQTLSRVCRFWGQTTHFYSVAQHCLVMADLFPDNLELQQWALIHEAFEGLTGMDVPSPIKHSPNMEEYRRAEDKALEQIAKLYGLQPPMPTEIKVADKRLMVTEALVLMNERGKNSDYWSELAQPYGMETIKLIEEEARNNDMRNVELRFLRKWNELFHSHKGA